MGLTPPTELDIVKERLARTEERLNMLYETVGRIIDRMPKPEKPTASPL